MSSTEEELKTFLAKLVNSHIRWRGKRGDGSGGGAGSCDPFAFQEDIVVKHLIERTMEDGKTLEEVMDIMSGALKEMDNEIAVVSEMKALAQRASLFQHGILVEPTRKTGSQQSEARHADVAAEKESTLGPENVSVSVPVSSNSSVVLQSPNGSAKDLPSTSTTSSTPTQSFVEELHGDGADQKDEEENQDMEIQDEVDQPVSLLEPDEPEFHGDRGDQKDEEENEGEKIQDEVNQPLSLLKLDEPSNSSDSSGVDASIEPEKVHPDVTENFEENNPVELSGVEDTATSTTEEKTFEEKEAEILGCAQQ